LSTLVQPESRKLAVIDLTISSFAVYLILLVLPDYWEVECEALLVQRTKIPKPSENAPITALAKPSARLIIAA
jgi:hypothetical protein